MVYQLANIKGNKDGPLKLLKDEGGVDGYFDAAF